MLGDSIYEIAHEKAGIIKSDVPVIVGKYQSSCDSVFIDSAKQCRSDIKFASIARRMSKSNAADKLSGPFDIENEQTARYALSYLNDYKIIPIEAGAIGQGLSNFAQLTGYIGRWQVLNQKPTIIADSAHNIDALAQVIRRLLSMDYRNLRMVLGFVREKDLSGILKLLPKDAIYYLVRPVIFRAIDLDDLARLFDDHDLDYRTIGSVSEGYNAGLTDAQEEDLMYVGGSSFVVGDLLGYLDK